MPPPEISIVIPTFNERENVVGLLPAVAVALAGERFEIVVVDDGSPDGTSAAVRAMTDLPVRVIDRGAKRGLAGAVRAGLAAAAGTALVVMDADWSHDPAALPRMVQPLLAGTADLVVGSRLVAGGSIEDWPMHRRAISCIASAPARRLTGVKDPMSGYFALHRALLPAALGTTVRGYKILLDLLVAVRGCRVEEVPIAFRDRRHGTTKLGVREVTQYLVDLQSVRRKGRATPDLS